MRRRQGFTLVELLVAMALVVFIMAILATAFSAASKSFRDLKAIGDMAERLRAVTGQLRRELAADHFEGKRRLSDNDFWVNGPPEQGFFRVWQGSPPQLRPALTTFPPPFVLDGSDAIDGGMELHTAFDHMLHFTVKLRGNSRGDFYSATSLPPTFLNMPPLPGTPLFPTQQERDSVYLDGSGTTYSYPWAEVMYFLRFNGEFAAGDIPLYALYRRQFLLVPDNARVQPQAWPAPGQFLEVSSRQDPNPAPTPPTVRYYFNNPYDITMPAARTGLGLDGLPTTVSNGLRTYPTLADSGATNDQLAADLVLTDVLSFEVKLLFWDPTPVPGFPSGTPWTPDPINPFMHLHPPIPGNSAIDPVALRYGSAFVSPLFQQQGPRVFDTWSKRYYPNPTGDLAQLPDYSLWNSTPPSSDVRNRIPMWNATLGRGPIIKAIQITIRVWDFKTSQTRQITFVQAL